MAPTTRSAIANGTAKLMPTPSRFEHVKKTKKHVSPLSIARHRQRAPSLSAVSPTTTAKDFVGYLSGMNTWALKTSSKSADQVIDGRSSGPGALTPLTTLQICMEVPVSLARHRRSRESSFDRTINLVQNHRVNLPPSLWTVCSKAGRERSNDHYEISVMDIVDGVYTEEDIERRRALQQQKESHSRSRALCDDERIVCIALLELSAEHVGTGAGVSCTAKGFAHITDALQGDEYLGYP